MISSQAGINQESWKYLLSFGGQNAAGPSVTNEDAYVSGFLKTFGEARERFGFDGIDIDIETGMVTPLIKAFRRILQSLHKQGLTISMAPQPINIDPVEVPSFMDGAFNNYVPLVDTTMIEYVDYIAVQLYNNAMPLGTLEKYMASMQQGALIKWQGKRLNVTIPSEKLVFGYPAVMPGAARSTAASWERTPQGIANYYKKSPELLKTGGAMTWFLRTWSVGWDASNGWAWIDSVSKIWQGTRTPQPVQ